MRDSIIDEMTKLYLMFTVPVVIFCEFGEIQFSIKWINPEAEQLYRRYEEILNIFLGVNRPDLYGGNWGVKDNEVSYRPNDAPRAPPPGGRQA